jgi:hypothetical protein
MRVPHFPALLAFIKKNRILSSLLVAMSIVGFGLGVIGYQKDRADANATTMQVAAVEQKLQVLSSLLISVGRDSDAKELADSVRHHLNRDLISQQETSARLQDISEQLDEAIATLQETPQQSKGSSAERIIHAPSPPESRHSNGIAKSQEHSTPDTSDRSHEREQPSHKEIKYPTPNYSVTHPDSGPRPVDYEEQPRTHERVRRVEPVRVPAGTELSKKQLFVDDILVEYWRGPDSDSATFRYSRHQYTNYYRLDCGLQRFLWVENRSPSGQSTGNSEEAEWKPLSARSTIANAVYDAICPHVSGPDFRARFDRLPSSRYEEQVAFQLLSGGLLMTSQGYELLHTHVDTLYRDNTHDLTLNLDAEVSYIISAVCDEDCLDIDIGVYDDNGNLIDKDTERDDYPYVHITPKWSARFTIRVAIPVCTAYRCTFGVGVFSR